MLGEYTRQGLRVLALAVATLPPGALTPEQLAGATQDELEAAAPLQLAGLAVMANPLRGDSAGVVEQLQSARMRVAMVTGDHLRTAVSVAGQCNILPLNRPVLLVDANAPPPAAKPAAVAAAGADAPDARPPLPHVASFAQPPTSQVHGGSVGVPGHGVPSLPGAQLTFAILYPDGSQNAGVQRAVVLPQVLTGDLECAVTGAGFSAMVAQEDGAALVPCLRRCTVWARMTPDNKRDLMGLLGDGLDLAPGVPHLGLTVAFCGDGANDCGALKAAHVGACGPGCVTLGWVPCVLEVSVRAGVAAPRSISRPIRAAGLCCSAQAWPAHSARST